jgi:hypothetical protein
MQPSEHENTKVRSDCIHLRSRMTYGPVFEQMGDWRTSDCTNLQYWCRCTMTTAGPDDDFVAPEVCQPARGCYQESSS